MIFFLIILQILNYPFLKNDDSKLADDAYINFKNKNYETSINRFESLKEKTTDYNAKTFACFFLGHLYLKETLEIEKGICNYREAIQIQEKNGIKYEWLYSNSLKAIGTYHNRVGSLDSAEYYFHKANKSFIKQNSNVQNSMAAKLGLIYYLKKEYSFGDLLYQKYHSNIKSPSSDYFSYLTLTKNDSVIDDYFKQCHEYYKNKKFNRSNYFYFYAKYQYEKNKLIESITIVDEFLELSKENITKNINVYSTDELLMTRFYFSRAHLLKALAYEKLEKNDQALTEFNIALNEINLALPAKYQRNLILKNLIFRNLTQFYHDRGKEYLQYLDSSELVLDQYVNVGKDSTGVVHHEYMEHYYLKGLYEDDEQLKDKYYWKSYHHFKKFIGKQHGDKDQLVSFISQKDLQDEFIHFYIHQYQKNQNEDDLLKALEIIENTKSTILNKRSSNVKNLSIDEYFALDNVFDFKKKLKETPLLTPDILRSYFKENFEEKNIGFVSYYQDEHNRFFIISYSKGKFNLEVVNAQERDFNLLKAFSAKLYQSDYFIDRTYINQLDSISHLLLPQKVFNNQEDRIMISADQLTSTIPLGILNLSGGKKMIEEHSISYAFSLHHEYFISSLPKVKNDQIDILGIAPFANKDLKFSQEEVEGITENTLINEEATKENVINAVNDYDIIHFATHTVIGDDEQSSRIFLYGHDSLPEGFTFDQVEEMDFSKHNLISVSSCYSANGKYIKGEGLMSFQRAFAYSQAPSVLAGLWKVNDQASLYISKKFFKFLKDGYEKDIALQKAKLEFFEDFPALKQNPMFWGSLIISGDIDPITKKSNHWLWLLFLILIPSICYFLWQKFKHKDL
ncbi:CHAT domain-containing protein [Flammeovirga sp. SubArs3]|uniref:CHAT domain-containing protein n=1 Tax=Flammeovirga sp. SubArs3 TaxID=2995316 RepID=UPI00248BC174|nr:CHAT domain-containing protein [Flammeovirga sp. SubArs3]